MLYLLQIQNKCDEKEANFQSVPVQRAVAVGCKRPSGRGIWTPPLSIVPNVERDFSKPRAKGTTAGTVTGRNEEALLAL